MEDVFKLMEREQQRDPLKHKLVEWLEQNPWSENTILKTEREQRILHAFLVEKKTIGEIADSEGLSNTSVRNIKNLAADRLTRYILRITGNREPKTDFDREAKTENLPLPDFDFDVLMVMQVPDESRIEEVKQILRTPVIDLNFTVRTENCLRGNKMEYLRDVVQITRPEELLKLRNFGRISLHEVEATVYELGLKWLGTAYDQNPVPLVRQITLTTAYELSNFSWSPETLQTFKELGIHTIEHLLMSRKAIMARNLPHGQKHIIMQRFNDWGLTWK